MADVIRGAKKRRERLSLMGDVPVDILINHVFVRLPVRSLVRCKGVCKQWLQLLNESELDMIFFKQLRSRNNHHHHQQKILCGRVLFNKLPVAHNDILKCPDEPELDYFVKFEAFRGKFYTIDLESSSSPPSPSLRQLPGFPRLHHINYEVTRTLGYCNGMLCLEAWNWAEDDYWKSKHLLFGNPSTGDYKILPNPIDLFYPPLIIGFGYDPLVDDYKFVRVDNITRNPHIFSLKLNSWTTNFGSSDNYSIQLTEKQCFIGIDDKLGSCVAGSIYWLVEISDKIVWFDLKDEEFSELPLPCSNMLGDTSLKVVGGGSLCIINVCHNNKDVFMWSMLKEEENNKQDYYWFKWMAVSFLGTNFWGSFKIYPLSFVNDGKVLCCVEHGLERYAFCRKLNYVLIDPETNTLEDFTIPGITSDLLKDYTFEVQHPGYIDSLVSPSSYC